MPRRMARQSREESPAEAAIARLILVARGQKVMLDSDLASLYAVTTKQLNQQVKRNAGRFPVDFVFRLTAEEVTNLNRSHIVTGSQRHRDPRFPPFAFTEHGAIMAAMVLNSQQAVAMSVLVVRAFVRLRQAIRANDELSRKVSELEMRVGQHDAELVRIVRAIRQLMSPPEPKRRGIEFLADLG